ncbi:poly(A) RNA polymerase, mitochondrial-like isoform X2 [Dreissena polymorpha]|uniref:poly(A) RNA polymerase, mitochondrial-like isoform X2 n=1 Tax=Dreissena polymorpha TaxID=45954 RepID=UPI00226403C9|nr:poly(A) RNA polymerase, mitochondrial-like isoform X2 [Dreissena polymorpha]
MAAAMAFSRFRNTFVCKYFQVHMDQIHTGRRLFQFKKYWKKGLMAQTRQKPHPGQQNSVKEPQQTTAYFEDDRSGPLTSNRGRASHFNYYRDFIEHNANIAYSSVLVKIGSKNSLDTVWTALSKEMELKGYSEVQHDGDKNTKTYLIEVKSQVQLNKIAPKAEKRIIGLQGNTFLHPGERKDSADSPEERTSLLQQLGQCKDVDSQLKLLYRIVSLPESSMRYHFFACKAVERYIRSSPDLRQSRVECFGSAPSGTALRHVADLDLTMFVPDVRNVKQCLRTLHTHLRKTPMFNKVENIWNARTPIVHMESPVFHLSIDISVNNLSGSLMSNVVFLLGQLHPSFLALVVFLKYWARVNSLAQGGQRWQSLTSYMLSVLLISHLQQLRQLPPLKDLYETQFEPGSPIGDLADLERIRFKAIPTSHNDREAMFQVRQTDSSMSELLCSFFKYYGEFDFRSHLIDVHNGVAVRQTHFFDIYVCNPHEERHNVCRNVTRDSLERFKELCRLSHETLTENKRRKIESFDSLIEGNGSVYKDRDGEKTKAVQLNSSSLGNSSRKPLMSEKITEINVKARSDQSFDKQEIDEHNWGIQTLLPLFHMDVRRPVKRPVESPVDYGNIIEDLFETTVIKTDDPDIQIAVNEEMHEGRLNSLLGLEDLKLAANDGKDWTDDVARDNDGLLKNKGDNKAEDEQSSEREISITEFRSESGGQRSGKLDLNRKSKRKRKKT